MENTNKENINKYVDEEFNEVLYDDEKLEEFAEEKILKKSALWKTCSDEQKKKAIAKEFERLKEFRKPQKNLNF